MSPRTRNLRMMSLNPRIMTLTSTLSRIDLTDPMSPTRGWTKSDALVSPLWQNIEAAPVVHDYLWSSHYRWACQNRVRPVLPFSCCGSYPLRQTSCHEVYYFLFQTLLKLASAGVHYGRQSHPVRPCLWNS